jgi:hypothetical protein
MMIVMSFLMIPPFVLRSLEDECALPAQPQRVTE